MTRLSRAEVVAVEIAYDELRSYWEVIGQESSLDAEEMPSERIPWAIQTLRAVLDRAALDDTARQAREQ